MMYTWTSGQIRYGMIVTPSQQDENEFFVERLDRSDRPYWDQIDPGSTTSKRMITELVSGSAIID